jgi:hypothetical protein
MKTMENITTAYVIRAEVWLLIDPVRLPFCGEGLDPHLLCINHY